MTDKELDYRFWLAVHNSVMAAQFQMALSNISVITELNKAKAEIELSKAKSEYYSKLANLKGYSSKENDMEETTVEQNQKGRIETLEAFLERLDCYLDNHNGITQDSMCHREAKLMLGKTKWGERVIYAKQGE